MKSEIMFLGQAIFTVDTTVKLLQKGKAGAIARPESNCATMGLLYQRRKAMGQQ